MFCGDEKVESKEMESAAGHFLMPGQLIRLRIENTGKHLKLDGSDQPQVGSDGGQGEWAMWHVHQGQDNKAAIRLQNQKNKERWLRIQDNGSVNAGGNGGTWTELIPEYHEPYKVSLASAKKPGQYIGFNKKGKVKDGPDSGSGKGSWLYFSIVNCLEPGMKVHLKHHHTNKHLKITKDEKSVAADGGTGDKATWVVLAGTADYPNGTLRFQNKKHGTRHLRITGGGEVNAGGDGGPKTNFIPVYFGGNKIALRSFENRAQHIGVNKKGEFKNGKSQLNDGPGAWFYWTAATDE